MRVNIDGVVGEITTMPGNSSIAISHGVYNTGEKGKGKGTEAAIKRMQMLKDLGYSYMLCTVDGTNEPQKAIAIKLGWFRLDAFANPRTGHNIIIYGCYL